MKKSFTLIELIVVIAIIAILAAIVAPNALKAIEKSQVSQVIADVKTIKTAAMNYYGDTGIWPIDNAAFINEPAGGVTGWDGPYVEKWPTKTPWGTDYIFSPRGLFGIFPIFTTNMDNERAILTAFPRKAGTIEHITIRDKIEEVFDDGNPISGQFRDTGVSWGGQWHAFLVSSDEPIS